MDMDMSVRLHEELRFDGIYLICEMPGVSKMVFMQGVDVFG